MNSQIFHGTITHCRHEPRRHAFEYRMYWFAVDLDELTDLDRKVRFFRYNHRALVTLLDRDYGGPGDGDIRHRIRQHIERAGHEESIARIELMTIPRVAGYVFNPVSFYLCSSANGELRILVAEVRNTFGEMHHYVARLESENLLDPMELRCRIPKQFYVSPFLRVNGEYRISVKKIDEELSISVHLHDQAGLVISASMIGVGCELDSRNLRRILCKMPLFALTIMTRIHWQAIRLYFGRRLTMFEKPVPSHPATVSASHAPLWLRLRTALVRSASLRRQSDIDVPSKDSV